jgi:hypothetical protein
MQLNLNRSSAAHDLVMESEPKADVLIASEPNKKRMDKGGWYVDTYRDAAIKVLNRKQKVENSGRGKGYVWVEIDGVRIVSGYASPNIGIEEFKKYLGRLENCIRHARLDVLVAGDLNAKSPIWGSGVEDNRGAALADLLSANNMFAQNLGEKATFVGARGQSVIDITCATSGLAPRIQNWKVEDTETLSDHRLITYEIVGSSEKERKNKTSAGWFWKVAGQSATIRFGRGRRPRGPTYARGTIRSLFEDQEQATQRTAYDVATRPPCRNLFWGRSFRNNSVCLCRQSIHFKFIGSGFIFVYRITFSFISVSLSVSLSVFVCFFRGFFRVFIVESLCQPVLGRLESHMLAPKF